MECAATLCKSTVDGMFSFFTYIDDLWSAPLLYVNLLSVECSPFFTYVDVLWSALLLYVNLLSRSAPIFFLLSEEYAPSLHKSSANGMFSFFT